MSVEQMKRFVEPRSVALFGVSRRTGEGTYNILEHLLHYGYPGKIYPINPNATEILGVKTYARVADIGSEVDLAVINLPRSLVPGIVKECSEVGIKSVTIATQGFADADDEEGKRLQKQLDELTRKEGVRIVGPNSLGIANPFLNFCTAFARINMLRIPVGTVCQTGMFFGVLQPNLLGKGIDIANAADVSFTDCLEYFEQDPETKVIALHIEGIRDTRRFVEVARRVARQKPLLALKVGKSEIAARAAQSHTGSLVGADEVWDAAFKQSGIIRVNTADELGDAISVFMSQPLMRGRRIGIISISGGLGVMAIDSCHQYNLEIAPLSPKTIGRVEALSPTWQRMGNPVDIWPAYMVLKHPFVKVLSESVDAVMSDKSVDAVLLIWGVTSRAILAGIQHVLGELSPVYQEKPLVCCLMGGLAAEAKKTLESTLRTAVYSTPHRAVRALGHLARYSAFRGCF